VGLKPKAVAANAASDASDHASKFILRSRAWWRGSERRASFEVQRAGDNGTLCRMASKMTAEVLPENACRPVAIS